MPTINDLHVDLLATSGDITSPISQDPALDANSTQLLAADDAGGNRPDTGTTPANKSRFSATVSSQKPGIVPKS